MFDIKYLWYYIIFPFYILINIKIAFEIALHNRLSISLTYSVTTVSIQLFPPKTEI